jgi:hypothetical protein
MDEQDYKNLIAIYQNKYFDAINQNIALEARELKYRQTIEGLNKTIAELETKLPKTKRTTKDAGDFA